MKKLISIALIACLLFGCAFCCAGAEGEFLRDGFTYRILKDGSAEITGCEGLSGDIVVSQKINGRRVTSIAEGAFYGCGDLTGIVVDEGIQSIGDRAFYGCASLTGVELPGTLERMGADVFGECRALLSVRVKAENAVFESVDGVLYNVQENVLVCYPAAKAETELIVQEGTVSIADKAFFGNVHIESVTLPESMQFIGYRTFYGCTGLKVLDMKGCVSIADYAFCGCRNLSEIHFPEGLETIGYGAFSGCSAILKLEFKPGLKFIGDSAFCECEALETVVFPEGCETIDPYAFYYCPNLTDVYLPESIESIGEGAFFDCANVTLHAKEGSYAWNYAQENGLPVTGE